MEGIMDSLVFEGDGLFVYCTEDQHYVVADHGGWIPGSWGSLEEALAGAKDYLQSLSTTPA